MRLVKQARMKDESNGPPRSQKCDCLRLKATTEPLNPIHSQERFGVVFHLILSNLIMALVRALISGMVHLFSKQVNT